MWYSNAFEFIEILNKIGFFFVVYRDVSKNKNILIARIFYATIIIIILTVIPTLQYCLPGVTSTDYGIIHCVMQMLEYYAIIGLSHWYKKDHKLLSDKLKNIQEKLTTKNNKQEKYLKIIIIWFILTICYHVSMFVVCYLYPEESNWIMFLLNGWYVVIMTNRNNNIATCVLNYSNMSEILLRLNEAVEDITKYYQKEEAERDEAKDRSICIKIDRLINLYYDICECADVSNKIFGIIILLGLSNIYAFNLLIIYWATTFYADAYFYLDLTCLVLSSCAVVILAVSGESVHRAFNKLRSSLARLNKIIPNDRESSAYAKNFLRTVKMQEPNLHACGIINLRMTLLVEFLSLTATSTIVQLQFTHVV